MPTDIKSIMEKQRTFYFSGKTKSIEFRINKLKKLQEVIEKRSDEIMEALKKDFMKCNFEAYTNEIFTVAQEIKFAIKNLHSWAKPKRVKTPMALFKAKSSVYYEPYGTVLIIGAWNYPFQLTISPLIGAIAAGNCSIVKPSELSLNTSKIVAEIIKQCFEEDFCRAVEGGIEESTALLNERFDLIFYTGSTQVGKIVAQAAAKHLTPTVLELGGKSPCIVDETTDINVAARRITWGKFINAGQTCVAPDYVLVHKDIKDEFLKAIVECIKEFYGADAQKSPDYCRIINTRHFHRISALLQKGRIVTGGRVEKTELYIEPTVIDDITWEDPIMQEEIFGPLLPVMEYSDLDAAIATVNKHEKPLALYFFSSKKEHIDRVLNYTTSGGACINATIMHLGNLHLPFGGVGNSGMGSYHGESSFEAFSHKKAVLNKSIKFDMKLLYPPYKNKLDLVKKLLG